MRILVAALVLAGTLENVSAVGSKTQMLANPIRKVVTLMQRMQKQIEEEGKEKEKALETFLCYCKNGDANLGVAIKTAEEKIPQLESSIKESIGAKAQMQADLKQARDDREEAKKALEKAKAIREKQAKNFAAEASFKKQNIKDLKEGIEHMQENDPKEHHEDHHKANSTNSTSHHEDHHAEHHEDHEDHHSSSFLQSSTGLAQRLRDLSVSVTMEAYDRELLSSFLSGESGSQGIEEILGIMRQLKHNMEEDLAAETGTENDAIKEYEALVIAKSKEEEALTKTIETKTARVGELSVSIAEMNGDLEDTVEALAEDKKMIAHLESSCKTKEEEWEEYKKMMSTELVALADTIKLLNDDDALDLFKKTLPSSATAFVQVQVTSKSMRRRALAMLKSVRKHRGHGADHRLDFLEMALHGGQMGFDKILHMVDNLMSVLHKEQGQDDSKKAHCEAQFTKHAEIKKGLEWDISDLEKSIADGEENMKELAKELADLAKGIKDLDKSVEEATATRKEENKEFTNTLATNQAAKDLLGIAKNRLNKFYNPDLYKAPPKRELSEEDRIVVNMGGTLAPTAAPGGIAGSGIEAPSFVQVREHSTARRQPAADMSFEKKGEESTGVITLLDMLIKDMTKENQVLELDEKHAQEEYETFMGDAKKKRAIDAKSITDAEGAKAEVEASVGATKLSLKEKKVELMDTDKFVMGLHGECDFILKFHDARKQARTDEIDALDKAKAVLNGADYSFLQTGSKHLRGS